MKLSKRDKFLINEAFKAGQSWLYSNSKEWFDLESDMPGAILEDQLAHEAAEIKEDDQ